MNNNKFWNNWPADFRLPYLILLFLGLAALGIGFYHYLTGADTVIRWETYTDLQAVDVLFQRFSALLSPFEIRVNGYLSTQRFDVSGPYLNVTAAWLYIILLAICIIFFLTVISTLKRFLYIAGMVLLLFFLAGMNPDMLGVISQTKNYVLIILMVIFGGVSYFFQAFQLEASFTRRLLIFTGIMVGVAAFLYLGSNYPADVTTLYLANHSTLGGAIASILFMVLVSFDNIVTLAWVNTQSENPAKRFGLWQFLATSLIYLLNLVLLFLDFQGFFDAKGLYIDAYIVLFLSAVSGFWVLRLRNSLFGNRLPFHPQGAFLYLVLAIITFISIGYAFATYNDPMLTFFSKAIIYTHLAFGTMFLVYVLINYGALIKQKLRIYRVIFDPKFMPVYSVYITGIVALVLMLQGNYYVYYQAMSGYYNYLGDLYKASGDDMLAIRYYNQGDVYENNNVKSNFALAGIYRQRHYIEYEIQHLEKALKRRPNEKVFTRLGNMYLGKDHIFEQIEVLQNATQKFPESGRLNNNMALVYLQTSIEDSVNYYLARAEQTDADEAVTQTNRLAFYIKNGLPKNALQIAEKAKGNNNPALQSNVALLQFMANQKPEHAKPLLPENNRLNQATFARLYHTTLQNLGNLDSTFVKKLNTLAADSDNVNYTDDLTLLKAFVQHQNQQPHEAKATLENLITSAGSTGGAYFADILGQWMLEQDLPQLAANYFNRSKNNLFAEAFVHHPYALALAGKPDEARIENEKVMVSSDPLKRQSAHKLRRVLDLRPEQALTASDTLKVQFLQIHKHDISEEVYKPIVASVQDKNFKMLAQKELADYYLKRKNYSAALQTINQLKNQVNAKSPEISELNVMAGKAMVALKNTEALKKLLQNGYFSKDDEADKNFYLAVVAENAGQLKDAEKRFDLAFTQLVYREDVILKVADYYQTKQKKGLKAYEILLDGITYNPYSAEIQKAYILTSLSLGLKDYALDGMERLQKLLPEAEYATFKQQFEAKMNAPEVWD